MCLGREGEREGCGWACSVRTVIGCRLSFSSSHKHTQQQCPPTTLWGTDGTWLRRKSQREGDFVWDFPSFLFSQTPAFSVFPRKSGALFSNWQRIILPTTPQHHTIFLFHWSRPLYYHGKCAFVLWAWNSGKCFWGRYLRRGLWNLKIWHQAKQRGSAQGKKTWFSFVLETVWRDWVESLVLSLVCRGWLGAARKW